jgi:hypothetical protein
MDLGCQGLRFGKQVARRVDELMSNGGRIYRLGATFEQHQPRLTFEQGDLLRHRRRAIPKFLGGSGERSMVHHNVQGLEVIQSQHRTSISVSESRSPKDFGSEPLSKRWIAQQAVSGVSNDVAGKGGWRRWRTR